MANDMYEDLVNILQDDIRASLEVGGDDPLQHGLGSALHTASTLAALNLKISDATLDANTAARTPLAHAASHEDGGADEISVLNLSGLLADAQTPLAHASAHEDGGADEISVLNLSGLLADAQTPLTHASSHATGGSDVLALIPSQIGFTTNEVASDAAAAIIRTDGALYLAASTAASKAVATTTSYPGQVVRVFLLVASGGDYTIAVEGGTITLATTQSSCVIARTNEDDAWLVMDLNLATFA